MVIFQPGLASENHWFFNNDGLLTDVKKPDGTLLKHFEYDENDNVVLAQFFGMNPNSFTFVYDANNHITSVNGKPLTFDTATGKYTEDYENPVVGAEYDFFDRYEYNVDANGRLVSEFAYYLSSDGNYDSDGAHSNFDSNGNAVSLWSHGGESGTGFTYDDHPNPLGPATAHITRALAVTQFGDYYGKFMSGLIASSHNAVSQHYAPEDPESHTFTYIYNANGLPQSSNVQSYYLGDLESDTAYAQYYYQGEILP